MNLASRVESLFFALVLDADESRLRGKLIISFAERHLNVADEMRGARHWGEHEGARLQEPPDADRENGVILVDDRGDAFRIGLSRPAWHPVDALRRIKRKPGLEFAGVEQLRFAQ